ncbi:4Fe-4S dicluster domain-containing protein [Desulfatitalea alkaliphila]|uniref:4Fe-4S binding protein n=1 Tax=Desulfatitalea alkaliphila TaxID=2929485 RepID=A0AA41ULZ2_9BACT|nr:4Fe-4S binding protein [Desulfatitalea alkaliphila]MCJ8502066.1 4Fe-4S binding protein [Desulfatitalea alkaliphila]
MAHLVSNAGYHDLVRRLNRFPQGAPPSDTLFPILKMLFSEKEAGWVSRLPIRVFSAEQAAKRWSIAPSAARRRLDDLCRRGLVVDFAYPDGFRYCLPPPMAGFFEFSMMRLRSDLDQKALAELLYHYINVEHDFAAALFARGEIQLGRIFTKEALLDDPLQLTVLDFERASHVIRTAGAIALGICYCRHKMGHLGTACDAPLELCLTFNHAAAFLIRHGHARPIESVEALDVLQRANAHHLVQFGENVRREVNFICNCCKCCCEAMQAARRFALMHPVHAAPFVPRVAPDLCSGCGLCATHCPVEAIAPAAPAPDQPVRAGTARVDVQRCLGCGVCAGVCPNGAITMVEGPPRVLTPRDTAHRTVLMAIERGTLPHILLNNASIPGHRLLAVILDVIFRLPPVQQLLAAHQLQSRYLEWLIDRLRWQPRLY